ncbi:MAG: ATP-binding protein [Burkholderiales bacterium]
MSTALRGSLLRKYVAAFLASVGLPLLAYGAVNAWLTYRDHRAAIAALQREQADAAAFRIAQFVRELEGQLGWATHLSWGEPALERRRLDALRVLRQAPAITDLTLVDPDGRERVHVSRLSLERIDAGTDLSADPAVSGMRSGRVHYGPVTFRRETEPFMTLAMAGPRRDAGVALAAVNLKHVWEVVAAIRVGQGGSAYVFDGSGRLIAHPDISLVLRNTIVPDAARIDDRDPGRATVGLLGGRVLAAAAPVAPLDWRVHVELPEAEADASLARALSRAAWVAAAGLALALAAAALLALRMVRPIRALTDGAARLGEGRLEHRIAIRTGDELEALGAQFNTMASELQASYATLERKVEARTRELADANLSKSRFLAAASHDLRQPLHALGLLVAQLRAETDHAVRERVAARVEDAVAAMNALFDGLLDISRLDAGVVAPTPGAFPIGPLLERLDATFADDAAAKGLALRVAPSRAWVRSDPVLLERVLTNLVANAVRYTRRGGIVVGVRRAGETVRIEVLDSGIGIPEDRQRAVFGEFYQIAPEGTPRGQGLGLGLAIVERLCALLGHRLTLASAPGRGTRVALELPRAEPVEAPPPLPPPAFADPLRGRRVLVVDDDTRVLDGTRGLLGTWGCEVVVASSAAEALEGLGARAPDLVIADVHLQAGEGGVETVPAVRAGHGASIPAVLVSGDVGTATRAIARDAGLDLLDKPVRPMALRALASRLLAAP